MPASLVYRTDDLTRWGTGQDSDLSATQIDINFWTLFSAVVALEDHAETLASIVGANVVGNQLFLTLSNDAVLGPLTLPTALWNAKGQWLPNLTYAAFDVVTDNGSVYLVTQNIPNSGATFNPGATDGLGHNLYMLLLTDPEGVLPSGGSVGNILTKAAGSPFETEWSTQYARIFCQVIGQPNGGELVLQYPVGDHMTLHSGLPKSIAFNGVDTSSTVTWSLALNGSPIGSIIFNGPSPQTTTPNFPSDIEMVPGDILTLTAPSVPDTTQANISFVFFAEITG